MKLTAASTLQSHGHLSETPDASAVALRSAPIAGRPDAAAVALETDIGVFLTSDAHRLAAEDRGRSYRNPFRRPRRFGTMTLLP